MGTWEHGAVRGKSKGQKKKCGLQGRFLLWRPVSREDFCSGDWSPGNKSTTNYNLQLHYMYLAHLLLVTAISPCHGDGLESSKMDFL